MYDTLGRTCPDTNQNREVVEHSMSIKEQGTNSIKPFIIILPISH